MDSPGSERSKGERSGTHDSGGNQSGEDQPHEKRSGPNGPDPKPALPYALRSASTLLHGDLVELKRTVAFVKATGVGIPKEEIDEELKKSQSDQQ